MTNPLFRYVRERANVVRTTKERYFTRISVDLDPNRPGFEARWIPSEDLSVERLLDIFTSMDANLCDVWGACADFMRHLYRHKPRLVVLGPKIERLPDDYPFKPQRLVQLSWLFESIGNRLDTDGSFLAP